MVPICGCGIQRKGCVVDNCIILDTATDPAMGSAGFLIEAQTYLRENHADMFLNQKLWEHFNNTMFYGNDMDRTMLRIGAMNMLLHGVENPNISYRDSLSEQNQTFTTLIVRLKPNNNPGYVCSYINSDFGKQFINSEKVGVAQQNVGAKSLAKMPIKMAPKEIQNEFATFVNQVDKSKVAVQKALDETQLLFDSLMQKYFG